MARANTRTMLPLDRWAAILGIEPRHFNGIYTTLRPVENCDQTWFQYAWQMADRVGREDAALAIAQAEADVIDALGFLPVPDWTEAEIVRATKPNDVMLPGNYSLYNARALFQSVSVKHGHVISGGVQTRALIATATRTAPADPADTLLLNDADGDGYNEELHIILPTTVTDVNEIRVYFAGHDGADEWEVRPLKTVLIAGGTLHIVLDKHLVPDPDLWEALNATGINGDVETNFVTQLDVYRVYNDPSDQCQLQWEAEPGLCSCGAATCETCSWATQSGCLQTRDPKLGILTYRPATWDAAEQAFASASLSLDRQPDRVSVNYLSGYRSNRVARPYAEMDPTLERIITYYSVTLLDRPICNCNNVESFIGRWREDRALQASNPSGASSYKLSARAMDCPWGTREGALWAWQQVQKLAIGQGVSY